MLVEIGLTAAKEGFRDESDELQFRTLADPRVLEIQIPDDLKTGEAFSTIVAATGVVANHSDEPPAWVACPDKPALSALLAEHYGVADGKPADVEDTHWTSNGPPAAAVPTEGA